MHIKLIKKNNEGVEIESGDNQGDLRYTPAAKAVAEKIGEDLLMAILAAASDEAWSQADEYEWKDAVDTDHDLEWNTCQALGWGFDDMDAQGRFDEPFKGDSGKVYSGDEAKNAYNAIAALEDDDRYSLFFNNQPRNYSHIRDVVATAMDMAADDEGEDEDESKKHEGSGVGDMTALINGVDRAHTKETLPLQAELHRLKKQRTARIKEILGDSVKNYFEDLGYEVPWVYLDWPSVSLTLKGPIDGYYFNAYPEVVLKSAYISQRSSPDPDHNKVITNYGGKYRRIPIDYNKRFTAQTPKPVQEKYFELLEALKGITKFASLVEKDPEIQELDDKIQDVAGSIKVHPLLSPGIT